MKKIFIQTNNKQTLGAILAKYAIEKNLKTDPIPVEILNVNELELFKNFVGRNYLRNGKEVTYTLNDLQSFTLSRFMPPELMNFEGRALVIDPDIFAITDINKIFNIDIQDKTIACCRKKDAYDTSVMILNCAKLQHWKIENILNDLTNKKIDYDDLITLRKEKDIYELPRIWNSLDELNNDIKLLHTTNRLTQPWKTGLPIDFTRRKRKRLLGFIPGELMLFLLGKYPIKYQSHPDKNIELLFFKLLKEALKDGAVSESFLKEEIYKKHLRKDAFKVIRAIP